MSLEAATSSLKPSNHHRNKQTGGKIQPEYQKSSPPLKQELLSENLRKPG